MVTTITPYTDPRNRANPGEGFDGVVRVSVTGYYGSGVLLFGGRVVLTAAHLFGSGSVSIKFETSAGVQSVESSRVLLHPAYDSINNNNDLALVWLAGSAPVQAPRYDLYRDNDEIGQAFKLIGYGLPGTGSVGIDSQYSGSPLRLKASNEFDADILTLKSRMGAAMGWSPLAGSQLVADFDDGTTTHNALGRLIGNSSIGLGQAEGLIAPGDSGSPAFIDGRVAGIASYTASLSFAGIQPDIDSTGNSSFGEVAAWQRVSYYQQWIDQSLRVHYPDAPTKPEEVNKVVSEGNSGTSYAYFLLQFTGMRKNESQLLSVDYLTRDGTARAGEDYIQVGGRLMLYPGENQAVIPVEIMGDTVSEADETFYLDVFDPVGGSFGEGVVKLTAMRTIMNDDGGIWG